MNQTKILSLLLPGSNLQAVKAGWSSNLPTYQGIYRDYRVILEPGNNTGGHPVGIFRVTINASLTDENMIPALDQFLANLAAEQKKMVVSVRRHRHAVVLELKATPTKKYIENTVNPITDQVIRYLEANRIPTGCQSCGDQDAPLESYTVNHDSHYLCHDCAVKTEQELKESQVETKKKTSNLFLGLIGAFLGGLIGVALWIGIDQLGYIAAISGAVMAAAACKGYELLGKALDRKGVIVCAVIVLVLAYFATKLCWTYAIYNELKSYGWAFGECFQSLGWILEEADLTGGYIGDMVLGYFFTVLGAGGVLYSGFKSASGSYVFRKNIG